MNTLSSWEETLKRFYRSYKIAPRPDLEEIVHMALSKEKVPENLDPGVREMVEMVAEWENYEWDRAPAQHPFDVLVCRVRETVEVLLSSLQWQAHAPASVRNGAALPCMRTRTNDGVELTMSRDPAGARLVLSFTPPAPQRVELKKDGQLVESVPVLGEHVEFTLPVPGIYELILCRPDSRHPLLALPARPRGPSWMWSQRPPRKMTSVWSAKGCWPAIAAAR